MNRALLSSKNNNWCTPKKFFDELDSEFHFVLDVAANEKSAKCKDFFYVRARWTVTKLET